MPKDNKCVLDNEGWCVCDKYTPRIVCVTILLN